jgi:hypothetical protein
MGGPGCGPKPSLFVTVGQRFGRLAVTDADALVGVTPAKPGGWRAAVCQCDCGQTVTVALSNLFSGRRKTCGHACEFSPGKMSARTPEGRARAAGLNDRLTPEQKARQHAGSTKHGLTTRTGEHPLMRVWYRILRRCENPAAHNYSHYGGRGIRVCERWHDIAAFIADIEAEIGPQPEGRHPSGRPLYSIDRIDNDRGYEPGNVRWATAKEQVANRRPQELEPSCITCGTPWDEANTYTSPDGHRECKACRLERQRARAKTQAMK